ncbi:unnamed protein product [Leptidea sinapis]|uniref:Uncharacterized protein n=1 Tax=Leptidea sinapis TaxID=189913 RepID=A0A5E4PZZ4_9NEOP|nr:unnamed protein product [Leptidea sinapis]
MRNSISAHERLLVTLRFLATGPYKGLILSAIISPQALGKIIPVTCKALYKVLRRDHLKTFNGKISNGGVLQNTIFFEKLENSYLHIPSSELLTGSNLNLP